MTHSDSGSTGAWAGSGSTSRTGWVKAEGLPDIGSIGWPQRGTDRPEHPHWGGDKVHEIYRRWRALADSYERPRPGADYVSLGTAPRSSERMTALESGCGAFVRTGRSSATMTA